MINYKFVNYWKRKRPDNRTIIPFKLEWWEEGWMDWENRNNYIELIIFNVGIIIHW